MFATMFQDFFVGIVSRLDSYEFFFQYSFYSLTLYDFRDMIIKLSIVDKCAESSEFCSICLRSKIIHVSML